MRLLRIGVVCALAGLLAGLLSCEEAPYDDLIAMRSALSALRDSRKGQIWAPLEFAAAASAAEAAERESAAQGARWGIFRDYERAQELIVQATSDIALASSAAEQSRRLAEQEAREALEAVGAAIRHAEAALRIAPATRDNRLSLDRLARELDRAEVRLAEIRNLITAEDFAGASRKADALMEDLSSLIRSASGGRG